MKDEVHKVLRYKGGVQKDGDDTSSYTSLQRKDKESKLDLSMMHHRYIQVICLENFLSNDGNLGWNLG